jgi:hypothetical protein
MSAPRYARFASKLLSQLDASPSPPDLEERTRAIAALGRAIEGRARKRRARLWIGAALGIAAASLAVIGGARLVAPRGALVVVAPVAPASVPQIVAHPVGGSSSVMISGAQGPLDDGRQLAEGNRVVTPADGRAMLSFATGSTVLLREGTDLTVTGEGAAQVLRLDAGSVDLHVAKLASGRRFVVATGDAEVEVRGTRFRVSVVAADPDCGAGTRTRVSVTEGVVTVRHAGVEDRVPAGEQWPGSCPAVASSAAPGRPTQSAPVATARASDSTLTEQNDLFAAAAAAKRRGDSRGALAALDAFVTRYPSSPLAESAAVERIRLLHAMAPSRGVAAARDYVARYPNGFARAEAEAIVAEGP